MDLGEARAARTVCPFETESADHARDAVNSQSRLADSAIALTRVRREASARRPEAAGLTQRYCGYLAGQHPVRSLHRSRAARRRSWSHERTLDPAVARCPRRPRPGDASYAGQKQYTPAFLDHIYDHVVVRFSNACVWRCRGSKIVGLYDQHVTDSHLDVGPGTGYFLDRCTFPSAAPEITLLDLNPHVLDAASRRIARYAPRTYQADLLEPLDLEVGSFGSLAVFEVRA